MSDYVFPAIVAKVALSSKKKNVLIEGTGEVVPMEVPLATITLTFHAEQAATIVARLTAYQGREVTLGLEGQARQLILI